MRLTDEEIAHHVSTVAGAIMKEKGAPTGAELAFADSLTALVTNLLQNINTIAAQADFIGRKA